MLSNFTDKELLGELKKRRSKGILLNLRFASNGWVIEHIDEEGIELVADENDGNEHEAFLTLIREVISIFGPTDNKYSPKRIRAYCLPGNSYEGALDEEYRKELEWLRDDLNAVLNNDDNVSGDCCSNKGCDKC